MSVSEFASTLIAGILIGILLSHLWAHRKSVREAEERRANRWFKKHYPGISLTGPLP